MTTDHDHEEPMTMTQEPTTDDAPVQGEVLQGEVADAPPEQPNQLAVPEPERPDLSGVLAAADVQVYDPRQGATTPSGQPIVPTANELVHLGQMAQTLSAAGAIPEALQGSPEDVFLILLSARDLGVDLTSALREFHVVKGKVTLSPKVRLGMVRRAKLGRIWPDPMNDRPVCPLGWPAGIVMDEDHSHAGIYDDDGNVVQRGHLELCGTHGQSATWHATRPDYPGHQFTTTWTMDQAIAAGAASTNSKGDVTGMYAKYPGNMLSWRALGYLLDQAFSEVGTGLYSPEELGATVDEQGEVIDVTEVAPIPGTAGQRTERQQQRRTRRQRGGSRQQPEQRGPSSPVADEAVRADLRARIQRLADYKPEARQLVYDAWTGKAEGCRRLNPLERLTVAEVELATRYVTDAELAVAMGELADEGEGPSTLPAWAQHLAAHEQDQHANNPTEGCPACPQAPVAPVEAEAGTEPHNEPSGPQEAVQEVLAPEDAEPMASTSEPTDDEPEPSVGAEHDAEAELDPGRPFTEGD